MEGPGISLFQGAASIHINNSAQDRLEEQEEIEDQKRRNEELKHKLVNAFDDLLDDDEASSVNSSGNFTLDNSHTNGASNHKNRSGLPPTYVESLSHLKESQLSDSPRVIVETPTRHHVSNAPCEEDPVKLLHSPYHGGDEHNHYYQQKYIGHVNGMNSYDARQEYMNNEQLKVMYEMRVKECQQLAVQMESMEGEVESLRARLAATASDRDKAELSLQEAHHLLASSKHQLLELEQRVTALTEKLMASEEEKEHLRLEVISSNISLQEAQQRLHTLQVAHSHDTDNLFREQQDRHREEVDRLQTDLINSKNRLEDKENEIKKLEKRCMEKDREKELMVAEKGTMINRVTSELESVQNRLMTAETARMKEKCKLDATLHELTQCRDKMAATQKELDMWRSTVQQIFLQLMPDTYTGAKEGEGRQRSASSGSSSGSLRSASASSSSTEEERWRKRTKRRKTHKNCDPPSPGRLATLKEVLIRQKQQLHKLAVLQEEIVKRDEKLEWYKKQDADLRASLDERKAAEVLLNSRIATLHNKVTLLSSTSDEDLLDKYKEQNERLQADLDETRRQLKTLGIQHAELELAYERLKSERASQEADADLLRELERYSTQLKDTLRENGDLKNLYLQACSTRDAATRELKEVQTSIQTQKEQFKTLEEEYIERIEREKEHVAKLMAELANCREELETANKRISELQREFTDQQKQFTNKLDKYLEDEKTAMRNEMSTCAQCDKLLKQIPCLEEQISQCTLKLAAQESNEQLMKELKDKAEFFQRYIMERYRKLGEMRTVGTSTEDAPLASLDKTVPEGSRDTDELVAKTALMLQEKAIRDQIADKYTLEMKTMEMNCSRRIKEMESQHYQTVMALKELVESKAQQVDVLKDKLLSEKAVATQMLDSKKNEISVLIKEHNELQNQCRQHREEVVILSTKLENRTKKMVDLKKELDESKEKVKTAASEYQTIKKKYMELKYVLKEIEQRYSQLQNELQMVIEKYNACKKTVLTYKDYIGKKDEHISSEMRRIQEEYREMFVKLQAQLNHHVKCRMHELRTAGASAPDQLLQHHDYSERMKKLGEEFAKITQFKEPESDQ